MAAGSPSRALTTVLPVRKGGTATVLMMSEA